jgi:hypothetical protein
MRRISPKRRQLIEATRQWRDDFRAEIGRCEKCLKPTSPAALDVHELVAGSSRAKALDKRYAVLCLHRACHTLLEAMTIPRQLAYLLRARPQDVDMESYYRLTGRRWPDLADIRGFYEELKDGQ